MLRSSQSAPAARAPFAPHSLLSAGRNHFRDALAAFIANAERMKIPGSVVQKLRRLQPRLLQKSAADFAATLNGFAVLVHGNAWTDNLLFRSADDGGAPTEALLLDFRGAFVGSPVIDLMFVLCTAVAYEVQRTRKDELLYVYHTRLTGALRDLDYAGYVPTLVELHAAFLRHGIFELMLTLTVAPYLRSAACALRPKLVPPFVDGEDDDDGTVRSVAECAAEVLATHAEDIIEELDVVERNGLLDWGAESSNLRRLLRGFQ